MQPDKPKNAKPPSFLGCFTVFCLLAGLVLATVTKFEAVLVLGGLFWFAVALPYTLVVGMIQLGKKSAMAPRPPSKPKTEPPKGHSKAEKLAEARHRYEASLAIIDAAGLSPAETRSAKEKARRLLMRAIDGLLE